MDPTTEMDYCEVCDNEVPAGELAFIETHRATRYDPADGMVMCASCAEDRDEAIADRMIAAWEARQEAEQDYGDW